MLQGIAGGTHVSFDLFQTLLIHCEYRELSKFTHIVALSEGILVQYSLPRPPFGYLSGSQR